MAYVYVSTDSYGNITGVFANPQESVATKQLADDDHTVVSFLTPSSGPQSVSPRQARLALNAAGLLDKANTAVNAAGGATLISWEYASVFLRSDPLIAQIGTSLGLTSAQIDALFVQAATL